MKPLHPTSKYVDCLLSMAKDVMTPANVDDARLIEKADGISRNFLADAMAYESSSPVIANRILRQIRPLTGLEDPYAEFKFREMAQAHKIFSQLKNNLADNLRSQASLAVGGQK